MNWLDIIILIFLAIAVVIGLKIGIIKTLFTVVGIIVGIVLAGRFSSSLGDKMTFISDPGTAKVVAFAIIMIVVLIISAILAAIVKWVASAVLLGWVNRLGGAILGLVLGSFFVAAVLTMWVKYLGINSVISDSFMASFLVDKFPVVLGLLPSEFDSVRSFFKS
jgi:membrane protein required for colicin V production